MKFTHLKIENYRNLNNIEIFLDENCNFIVGENNLGKSNLLNLINTVFSKRAFWYEDFNDPELPIEVRFQIKLASVEIGHFQDLFDIDDYSKINVTAKQENPDDLITFYHTETETFISHAVVKCLNYIHYDSLRNPVAEINFDKGKGVGKFLRNIISQYLEANKIVDAEFLDEEKVSTLIASINQKISKIKSFGDFGFSAASEDNAENLLSRIVILKDGKGENLSQAGYGVQFLILVTLSVLEKLQSVRKQRGERGVFLDEENGKKSISLVVGLDEPEIHLHPYMQRSLIKYLNSVVSNDNPEFKELVKELFDIDEFIGQILVVTHSPNIILNDYKQIIRFFLNEGSLKVVSGSKLDLNEQLHKHLYLQFPFIKEAFFSRCVIFVEGDSEYSSFPVFGQTLSMEFDDLGICMIQARGKNAIPQLFELANSFGIPSVGITDKDDGIRPPTLPYHYATSLRDFEEELIVLIDSNKENVLRTILCRYDSQGTSRIMDMDALNKRAHREYGVGSVPFASALALENIDSADTINLKAYYLTWFSINKSYPLGLLIGETLTEPEIPAIYVDVIRKAKELVENV